MFLGNTVRYLGRQMDGGWRDGWRERRREREEIKVHRIGAWTADN